MFNLLPEKLKKEIKTEYRLRKSIVILVFMLSIQVSFLIFLLPTWISSFYKEKESLSQLQEINQSVTGSGTVVATDVIKSLNTKLNILNSSLEYPSLIPLVDIVLSKKSTPILLNKFVYVVKDGKTAEFVIGGVSNTREALVSFVKHLEETKSFKTADLPISNLAKDKNIDFSITLTIAPQ